LDSKLNIIDNFVDANKTTPSDDKEYKMRLKKVSCLKVMGMTVFGVLAVLSIKDMAEKGAVQTDLAESVRSQRNNIWNITSSQSSISSKLPDNSFNSSLLAGDSINQLPVVDSLAGNRIHGLPVVDSLAGNRIHGLPVVDSLAGNRIHGLPHITQPGEDMQLSKSNPSEENILTKIQNANTEQVISNGDLFGSLTNDSTVIVIQVHDRLEYLRQLIKSLSLAAGIDQALLIFSHDVWEEELNILVRSIDFCQTLQIFYPFSLQTHKHSFPGESESDCPRDADKKKAQSLSCTNAAWPDLHGHYREAQFTQTKHHWWWKANQVFSSLRVTQDFTGLFLFLEEDHYVSEDFLHVLRLMSLEKKKSFPEVDILSLGTYLKKFNFRANGKQAEITEWVSARHNMGMAFSRVEWNKMVACTHVFCKYDDYNWDWSLQHVSLNCMQEKLQVMMVKGPRVFHIGECGVHHKKANCNSKAVSEKVKKKIESAKTYFFPKKISVAKSALKKAKLKKANGGWGDTRDHQLCTNFTISTRE